MHCEMRQLLSCAVLAWLLVRPCWHRGELTTLERHKLSDCLWRLYSCSSCSAGCAGEGPTWCYKGGGQGDRVQCLLVYMQDRRNSYRTANMVHIYAQGLEERATEALAGYSLVILAGHRA